MKDLLFINSNLLNNFWVDVIDITNYLKNRTLTKYKYGQIILYKE